MEHEYKYGILNNKCLYDMADKIRKNNPWLTRNDPQDQTISLDGIYDAICSIPSNFSDAGLVEDTVTYFAKKDSRNITIYYYTISNDNKLVLKTETRRMEGTRLDVTIKHVPGCCLYIEDNDITTNNQCSNGRNFSPVDIHAFGGMIRTTFNGETYDEETWISIS